MHQSPHYQINTLLGQKSSFFLLWRLPQTLAVELSLRKATFIGTFLLILLASFMESVATAKLKVIATTPDVAAITLAVGGEFIELDTIVPGGQNPHSVETKPSFVLKLNKSELLVTNGIGLEAAWLPGLLKSSKNLKIASGSRGYFELGSTIEPMQKEGAGTSKHHDHTHSLGNPHFTLDPLLVVKAARALSLRLIEMLPENSATIEKNFQTYEQKLKLASEAWTKRIQKAGVTKVVTFHESFNYFLKRFNIQLAGVLEPREGIPPTASHLMQTIKIAREQNISLILVEGYFDTKTAQRVVQEAKMSRVAHVQVSVSATPNLKTIEDVIEQIVKEIESK